MKMWNDMRDQCKAGTCDNKAMVADQAPANSDKPAAAKAKPARAHR
jgi:hypothetical protein